MERVHYAPVNLIERVHYAIVNLIERYIMHQSI